MKGILFELQSDEWIDLHGFASCHPAGAGTDSNQKKGHAECE